ncbi:MAG: rlpA [Betaproteobacteria bacterium]|nr:rlpA [Betaproteobacteria bacterium]
MSAFAFRPMRPLAIGSARWVLLLTGFILLTVAAVSLAAGKPASGGAEAAAPAKPPGQTRFGLASYYGKGLQGKKTADGERFDKNEISAAHPTYPLGTRLRVTNLRNGRSVNLRVNDRGPTKPNRDKGVIIDLSEQAAHELGFARQGRTRVKTEVLEWGEEKPKSAAAAEPA